MKNFEEFLQDNNLRDPEDIEALLEIADLTRHLICDENYSDINRLINYTIENDYYEAFSWILYILQEEFDKEENNKLKNFTCDIRKSIPNYKQFTERLRVDLNVIKSDVETTLDCFGEVDSFFNIFTYKTAFKNIFLITAENFDTKDNDFIQYKILFARDQTVSSYPLK